MNESIPDLQELVHHWPLGTRSLWGDASDVLFYVRVSDAERLLDRIKELEADNARLLSRYEEVQKTLLNLRLGGRL